MREILIGSNEDFVKILVKGRKYPNCFDSWDGGWLNTMVELSLGRFKGSFNADLRIDEFRDFLDGLCVLSTKTKGRATYQSMEEWLSVGIESVDLQGHFIANVLLKDSPEGNNRIMSSIKFDHTYIQRTMSAVKDMLNEYDNIEF